MGMDFIEPLNKKGRTVQVWCHRIIHLKSWTGVSGFPDNHNVQDTATSDKRPGGHLVNDIIQYLTGFKIIHSSQSILP